MEHQTTCLGIRRKRAAFPDEEPQTDGAERREDAKQDEELLKLRVQRAREEYEVAIARFAAARRALATGPDAEQAKAARDLLLELGGFDMHGSDCACSSLVEIASVDVAAGLVIGSPDRQRELAGQPAARGPTPAERYAACLRWAVNRLTVRDGPGEWARTSDLQLAHEAAAELRGSALHESKFRLMLRTALELEAARQERDKLRRATKCEASERADKARGRLDRTQARRHATETSNER